MPAIASRMKCCLTSRTAIATAGTLKPSNRPSIREAFHAASAASVTRARCSEGKALAAGSTR